VWRLEDQIVELQNELATTKDKLKVAERALALLSSRYKDLEPVQGLTKAEEYKQLAINQILQEEKNREGAQE